MPPIARSRILQAITAVILIVLGLAFLATGAGAIVGAPLLLAGLALAFRLSGQEVGF